MDFETLKKFHKNPPINGELKRKPEIEELYKNYKKTNDFIKNLFTNNIWIITENKFPYDLKPNIDHKIIWFKNTINYKLIDFLFRDQDIVYFENCYKNKSIKSILHVHIFIKNDLYI